MFEVESAADLLMDIESCFEHVALEEGIGVRGAEAIDRYVSDGSREKERRKDQRANWETISDEMISQHHSA